jgi:molybdopterin molybdotransferase
MISSTQAESIVLNLTAPITDQETIPLATAQGRILAAPIAAAVDFPHWDNSAMDGYAVRYEDVAGANLESIDLQVVTKIPAGTQPHRPIAIGEAARIYTGAMLPPGADTIVMQEDTTRAGDMVRIDRSPARRGNFVRKQGEYAIVGAQILERGVTLNAPELAIAAACGCATVDVYRQPRIAIISTGNELVTIDRPLQPGQIIDSNHYAISAFVTQAGAIPISLGIIPDDRSILTAQIGNAIAIADAVISTGGVSVGDYDYVESVLAELGGDIQIKAVAIKPGKPLTVAKFPTAIYFGLPGNPVSALVSCWRFLLPSLRKLSGLTPSLCQPTWLPAKTTTTLKSDGKRESYIWGTIVNIDGEYQFSPASGSHSSGNLINLAGTNALAVIPIDRLEIRSGMPIRVLTQF